MKTLRCGRLPEHEPHEWRGRDRWMERTTYACTGRVLTTLAEQEWAGRADSAEARDDDLREWLREAWSA